MNDQTVILLAAGQSKRMKQPKQLLLYQNKPLVRHVLDEILALGATRVIVVLGAYHEAIAPVIAGLRVHPVVNPQWETGMAGSIQIGLAEMRKLWPESASAMICLVDQPFLKSEHYGKLAGQAELEPEKIIASAYQGILGAPAIFPGRFQQGLWELEGDQGAGKWLRSIPDEVVAVEMPEAAQDWDRPEDVSASGQSA